MIRLWRSKGLEQRQLALSLVMNLATRLPSILILIIFLPRMLEGLGTETYSQLLAALALGALASFPFGGFASLGTRIVGEAKSRDDNAGVARGFRSLVAVAFGGFLGIIALLAIYVASTGEQPIVLLLAALPVLQVALNSSIDATRLGLNEHYKTATLGLFGQILIFGLALLVPAFFSNILLSALLFHGPLILASAISGILLLSGRPELMRGDLGDVRQIASQGFALSTVEGLLMAPLGIVVVWLQAVSTPAVTAWFATVIRLYQMFITPLLMLVVPISAYIRLSWVRRSSRQRQQTMRLFLAISFAYGVAIAVGLFVLSRLYVGTILDLPEPGSLGDIFGVFLLLGVITAYRGYSATAYLVLDYKHLARWTLAVLLIASGAAVSASFWMPPLSTVKLYCLMVSVPIAIIMIWTLRHGLALRINRP